eukprot:15694437-Heterocapsa_arctica.AAC.1
MAWSLLGLPVRGPTMPWDVRAIQPVACAPRITFFGPVPDAPAIWRSEGERPEDPAASDDSGQ